MNDEQRRMLERWIRDTLTEAEIALVAEKARLAKHGKSEYQVEGERWFLAWDVLGRFITDHEDLRHAITLDQDWGKLAAIVALWSIVFHSSRSWWNEPAE